MYIVFVVAEDINLIWLYWYVKFLRKIMLANDFYYMYWSDLFYRMSLRFSNEIYKNITPWWRKMGQDLVQAVVCYRHIERVIV